MALLGRLGNYKNTGLLILRVGLGAMMIFHGLPKLTGGPGYWEAVGSAAKNIGITFYPLMWGLLAAITETFGGFLLIIGLAFRPACLFLTSIMVVAALNHLNKGEGWGAASHAIELGFVFVGLAFIGAGKYSIDKK
ncbi:DoxX family protein [Rubrolithibacter danxiaensis]|uniref:DoxX family protein n=1 Tax=Rubrolithibacter danxiaensis TaxID=3390805 RepID=UPI003BF84480